MTALMLVILLVGSTVPVYSWLGLYPYADQFLGWRAGSFCRLSYLWFCVSGFAVFFLGVFDLVAVPNLWEFTLCFCALVVLGNGLWQVADQ